MLFKAIKSLLNLAIFNGVFNILEVVTKSRDSLLIIAQGLFPVKNR